MIPSKHFYNLMYSLGGMAGHRVKFLKVHKATYVIELFACLDLLLQSVWYFSGLFQFGNSKSFAGMAGLMGETGWGALALFVSLTYIMAISTMARGARRFAIWGMLNYFMFMVYSLILSGTGTVGIANRALISLFLAVSILVNDE